MPKKKVLLLGASGSIGFSTLDIIKKFNNQFELVGFSVHSNKKKAKWIQEQFRVNSFCFTKKENFVSKNEIDSDSIKKLIEETKPDIILNGIAGSAGLRASVLALEAGIDLALANKETIVNAGYLVRALAKKNNAKIIPVDSEHSAIFNLINSHKKENIAKIIITASGGPFKNYPREKLSTISPAEALKHPTWNMGGEITIDSATLANKGLEVIEAVKLFDIPVSKIDVTVHPQSIVHSMVQTINGEIYAQMSPPDMRNPIFNALSFPNMALPYLRPLDFTKNFNLEFIPPRYDDFPMLKWGFEAATKLKSYPLAFNCANEEAVQAFIDKKLKFTDISIVVNEVLQYNWDASFSSLDEVYEAERIAREKANLAIRLRKA